MMHATTINARGRLFSIDRPLIMGIINATPDSFFRHPGDNELPKLISQAEKMVGEGAHILDIGGQSTRPGATQVTAEEEWNRVEELLKTLRKMFPDVLLSIDTFHATVAERAASEGIDMVNDISAGTMDQAMIPTMAGLRLPYIAMHMQGQPDTMQRNPVYQNVTQDIISFFISKIHYLEEAGIKDILIDPGFGFGKTPAHNFQLLRELQQLTVTGKIVVAGLSRKSFIYRPLETTPDEALNGTTVLHTFALQNGAGILRVHDVRQAWEAIKLFELYQGFGNS